MKKVQVLFISLWWLGLFGATSARADEVPIVYSRCPRTHQPFPVTGTVVKGGTSTSVTVQIPNGDLMEMLPDTANMLQEFVAPCDLVYRDAAGQERVLYDCIGTVSGGQGCAALDAAVSFDAKTVAFSVFRGKLEHYRGSGNGKTLDPDAENTSAFSVDLPGTKLMSTEAQLYLVDVASGKLTALPHAAGTFDFGPAWLSNGRLAFTSTRARVFRTMPLCTNTSALAPQVFTVDVDGRNVEQASPHALAGELHPLQLRDGRLALSSWQMFGMQAMRHPNGVGNCGTLPNFFHLFAQAPDGADAFALYGPHVSDPTSAEYPYLPTHVAAHFLGQSSDGRLWTAEYYRGNNLGLGAIVGLPLPPPGQEGPNPDQAGTSVTAFRPPGMVRLAPWASMSDQVAPPMPAPEMRVPGYADPLHFSGKLGHPSGLSGNRLLVTWGLGPCSKATGKLDLDAMKDLASQAGDNPWCDTGIYRTAPLPPGTPNILKHPSELVPVVNRPEFHEFMARPVVPYRDVHGVDQPADLARAEVVASGDRSLEHGTPFGVLGASSILLRETRPRGGFVFENPNQWGVQGTDTVDYSDDELCGVRILAVHPNRELETYKQSTSTSGERVAILGEFPVRKFDASGQPVKDALGLPDTSFRVRFPANVPYLMQGIDCEGRTLNTDQTWQSLRPGEVKTCNGCHVHSSHAEDLPFPTTEAAKLSAPTVHLGEGKVPLLTGGSGREVATREVTGFEYMIEFERDVMPIFQQRCVSCHGATRAEAGLRLDLPRTPEMKRGSVQDTSTYRRLALDGAQQFVPTDLQHLGPAGKSLAMPNLSKYVRMLNARGSLLYWKARNARTDGRTDGQFPSAPTTGVTNSGQFDVDFGADHPTSITPEELGVLSRWIDTGAGWGPEFTQDTLRPSLHVVADAQQGEVSALRIGTADVGDGIDTTSLEVCVAPSADAPCGPNLPATALAAGVTSVALTPALTQPDTEVRVRVKDQAGNLSEARYTVGWLLHQPAPKPSSGPEEVDGGTPDAGTPDAGTPGDGGDGGSPAPGIPVTGSGCGCSALGSAPLGGILLGAALLLRRRRT